MLGEARAENAAGSTASGGGVIDSSNEARDEGLDAGGIFAGIFEARFSIARTRWLKGKVNEPSWEKVVSHFPLKMPMMLEMSVLERLTRTSGARAAAKAIAPQARTEKTVEKRILIERAKEEVWKGE